MKTILHITSGDCAGGSLEKSGLPGEVFVWHDILYDGPRMPGWPSDEILSARASFLEQVTGGGLTKEQVLQTLKDQYRKLAAAEDYAQLVLWFDGCLFDQSMLAHLLMLLHELKIKRVELLCLDAFPGIEPFDGLGQLQPSQLASVYDQRRTVTEDQFTFAETVDQAFARRDLSQLTELSNNSAAPLPWVPAAVARWLQEQPDPVTGLGRLEQLVLHAIGNGCKTPGEIFSAAAANDTHPQYWGDITLWAKINGLADRNPPLVQIDGPMQRLPQWQTSLDLNQFTIKELKDRSAP
jgi:hypothetical protein